MLEYSTHYLQALLDGIVDSDGYPFFGPKQPRVSTCSFGLVCDLMEIGFKLGLICHAFSEREVPRG